MTPRVISPYLDRPGLAKANNSLMRYFIIVEWGEGSLGLHAGSEPAIVRSVKTEPDVDVF